jgi:hypothetical protein
VTSRRPRARRGWAVVAVFAGASVVTTAGCTAAPAAVVEHHRGPTEVRADLVPKNFAGFTANLEDIAPLEKEAGKMSYLAHTRLWALRQGDRLRATLQVGTFVANSNPEDHAFQQTLVSQIASAAWRTRTLGGLPVFVTSANHQPMYIWIKNDVLFVLTLGAGASSPRAVLRQALGLQP